MSDTRHQWSDAELTAYLDGALTGDATRQLETALADDAGLSGRLAALDFPMDQLQQIMAPDTLGAPAIPEHLLAPPRRSANWSPLAVAAAFVLGVGMTYLLTPMFTPEPKAKWVDAVASYQALYVTQTLEGSGQDPDATAQVLTQAQADFEVGLEPALAIEGLDFKRAQLLGWNGKPLLQMAYLADDGTPLALCLTRVGAADRGPVSTVSNNLAGVSWVSNGVGYYLVGGQDLQRVEALSRTVIARL